MRRLTRALYKSRKIRRLERKYIAKNVPKSSRFHQYIHTFNLGSKLYSDEDKRCLCKPRKHPHNMKGKTSTCDTALNKTNTKPVRNNQASNNYCNLQLPVYKSLNHRLNYCHFCLCRDIEKKNWSYH